MRHIFSISAAIALMSCTSAHAAIEASAYIGVSSFTVNDVNGGGALLADVLTIPGAVPGADISITTPTGTGSTSAVLNGLASPGDVKPNTLTGVDPTAAFSNGIATVYPGAQNDFGTPGSRSPLGGGLDPYARADALQAGSIVDIPELAASAGASGQTIADVVIPTSATIDNLGTAGTSVALGSAFNISLSSSLDVNFSFDYDVELELDATVPPAGLVLSARTDYQLTLIGTSGTALGTSFTLNFDGADALDPTAPKLDQALSIGSLGYGSYSASGTYTSPTFTLPAGDYILSLSQGSVAQIDLPEPFSFVVWGALGSLALAQATRRRS